MASCGWCGKETDEQTKLRIEPVVLVWGSDDKVRIEECNDDPAVFCCTGCCWAFSVEVHRLRGMSGKEIREHLIWNHELAYPPGAPAGKMTSESRLKFETMANEIKKFFGI